MSCGVIIIAVFLASVNYTRRNVSLFRKQVLIEWFILPRIIIR